MHRNVYIFMYISFLILLCSNPLQNKTCVQTLEGHALNVSSVIFHPTLPVILSGSEDGNFHFLSMSTTFHFPFKKVLHRLLSNDGKNGVSSFSNAN